jgi:hypothetical protein
MISKGKKGQKQAIYQESYNLMGVPHPLIHFDPKKGRLRPKIA